MNPEQEIKLRAQLDELHQWPSKYMFKFIIPNDPDKRKEMEDSFDATAKITSRLSSKGTYSSYTIVVDGESTDHIIEMYRKVAKIEGVKSL
jgi:putative lipoic acid-binding regulatory protein